MHRLVEGVVDFFFAGSWIGQIDRFVLLAKPGDFPPTLGARIDDRRLVAHWNRGLVDQIEGLHETLLLGTLHAVVPGCIVVNAGLDLGLAGHRSGRHRHRLVCHHVCGGLERHLGGHLAGLAEGVGRALVAIPDTLLDQGPVPLGELLDPFFPLPQLIVEPHPLRRHRPAPFGCQVAFRLFTGANHRFADADFDLTEEPVPHAGIEIIRRPDLFEQILEVVPGSVGIDRHHLPGCPQPDRCFLFQLLGTHLPQTIEVGQFVGIAGKITDRSPGNLARRRGW